MEDVILQILEDAAAFQPVDDLMVESQEHVHHGPGPNAAVRQDDRPEHGAPESADGGLGGD